jgi:hypothetical protein
MGEVSEPEGVAAQSFQAAVNGFGDSVTEAGPRRVEYAVRAAAFAI